MGPSRDSDARRQLQVGLYSSCFLVLATTPALLHPYSQDEAIRLEYIWSTLISRTAEFAACVVLLDDKRVEIAIGCAGVWSCSRWDNFFWFVHSFTKVTSPSSTQLEAGTSISLLCRLPLPGR